MCSCLRTPQSPSLLAGLSESAIFLQGLHVKLAQRFTVEQTPSQRCAWHPRNKVVPFATYWHSSVHEAEPLNSEGSSIFDLKVQRTVDLKPPLATTHPAPHDERHNALPQRAGGANNPRKGLGQHGSVRFALLFALLCNRGLVRKHRPGGLF